MQERGQNMPGTLYIVTTPIGNLQDLTPRAASTFAEVDFIAAEDTRVTMKLLNYLELKKPLISYYEHNASQRGETVLARILAGENCALCSDAGVPAISDPGQALVEEALAVGIRVVPIPAASAAITALCASGQNTSLFVFEGFLPQNKRQRGERLQALQTETRTIIFYEAPHKLPRTMKDLLDSFGENRSITICRELTKLHEEIWKTTIAEAYNRYTTETPRGEFVLVMAGEDPSVFKPAEYTLEQAVTLAKQLISEERLSTSEAAKKAAFETKFPKSEIYKKILNK